MNFLISDAWAQAGGQAAGGIDLVGFLPLLLIFVVFYFMLIRPQQKRAKEHKEMTQGLKKGDEVITTGGALGRIGAVSDNFITLEVAENVDIKVERGAVSKLVPKGTIKSA